jgi:hypothetical protein
MIFDVFFLFFYEFLYVLRILQCSYDFLLVFYDFFMGFLYL